MYYLYNFQRKSKDENVRIISAEIPPYQKSVSVKDCLSEYSKEEVLTVKDNPVYVFNRILKQCYIEDIYFLEVNTKYISLSVLKTLEFSRVHDMSKTLTR